MRVSLPWRERHLGIQPVELEATAPSILREGMMAEGHSLCQARVLLWSVTGPATLGTWCQSGDFSWAMKLRGREKRKVVDGVRKTSQVCWGGALLGVSPRGRSAGPWLWVTEERIHVGALSSRK